MEFEFDARGVPRLPRLPKRAWGGETPARWSPTPGPSTVAGCCSRCRIRRAAIDLRWARVKEFAHGTWVCKNVTRCKQEAN